MVRSKQRILICMALILILFGLQFSEQGNDKSDKEKKSLTVNPKSKKEKHSKSTQNDSEKSVSESSKNVANLEKIKAGINKPQKETKNHQNKNNATEPWWKPISNWITAIGTLAISLTGLFIGSKLNKTQEDKIEQDRKLGREKHLLDVFKELGSSDPRIRIGAVAILIQKIEEINEPEKNDENKRNNKKSKEEISEFFTILDVLLAETKHEEKEAIQKYIADSIAKALDARVPDDKTEPETTDSPLIKYKLDFQKTKLCDAWWRRIDGRKVDFFEASFIKASLREAFLQKAVFYKADLSNSTLKDAHLEFANLQEAKLIEANLSRANLKGAKLQEACLEKANLKEAHIGKLGETELEKLFPAPKEREKERGKKIDFSKASLKNADIRDVDLTNAIINGANFKGAIVNEGTKLKKEQFQKAKFDKKILKIVTLID